MSVRIAIASGGTGGHFYPSLAIARELSSRGASVTMIVAGAHAESQLRIVAESGLEGRQVSAFRLPRNPLSIAMFPVRLYGSVRASQRLLRELAPDILLGMGSFAAIPACLGAVRERIPLVLHEGNAWMGRANRFLSRWAVAAGVSLPLDPRCRVKCPTVQTGMPLREALVAASGQDGPPADFMVAAGLTPGVPTTLVFGGSLGARFVNGLMAETAPLLKGRCRDVQMIHLTGTDDNEALMRAYAEAGIAASVRQADPDIQNAYLAADLVICRAGASSLCELALFGKPAILIPLPSAAEDHQTANAGVLQAAGAALRLPQHAATPASIAQRIEEWLTDPSPYSRMGEAIRSFAVPDAAVRMADLCLRSTHAG